MLRDDEEPPHKPFVCWHFDRNGCLVAVGDIGMRGSRLELAGFICGMWCKIVVDW